MVFEDLSSLAQLRRKKNISLPPVPSISTLRSTAVSLFIRNAVFGFNGRVGLSLFFQFFSLLPGLGSKKAFNLTNLFDIGVMQEALRWGVFLGAFSAQHEFLKGSLSHCRNGKQDWFNSFVAATSAGPWYLILPENRREWLTLYGPARAISATWSWLVSRQYVRAIDSGSILFILTSSQIMYGYVARPETLRESYWKFIINAGPLDHDTLGLVKSYHRGVPALAMGREHGTTPALGKQLHTFLTTPKAHVHGGVPCHIMHPGRTCSQQRIFTFRKGFTQALALYGSLGFFTQVGFNFKRMITAPLMTAWYLATSTVRSAMFLALFPTIYMTVVCLYKSNTRLPLHRYMYWLAGLFGGLSIYIERSGRRFELAMFALPRAVQSVANIGVSRGFWPFMSLFPMVSFSVSMGIIMTAFDVERSLLVPTMQNALGWIFPHHSKLPLAPREKRKCAREKQVQKSGKYIIDALEITVSPRIEEVLEYAEDEEEDMQSTF